MDKTKILVTIVLAISIGHGACQNSPSTAESADVKKKLDDIFGTELLTSNVTAVLSELFGNNATTLPPASSSVVTNATQQATTQRPDDTNVRASLDLTTENANGKERNITVILQELFPDKDNATIASPPASSPEVTKATPQATTPRPPVTTVRVPAKPTEKAGLSVPEDTPLSLSCRIEKTNKKGECTPYYLCSNGTTIPPSGSVKRKIIDLRIEGECPPLQPCCAGKLEKPLVPEINVATGCGYRNPQGLGFEIRNAPDRQAQEAEFPWSVAILVDEKEATKNNISIFQCGGSLIHPQVVMTVAHCINENNRQLLIARAGEWDSLTTDEYYKHQDIEVEKIIIHKDFVEDTAENDIALLILRSPFKQTENVNTICLPPVDSNFDSNAACFASGWGQSSWEERELQSIMKKIELPIVPSDQCQKTLRTTRLGKDFKLHDSFICAGGEVGKDTCTGDGGSPLMCRISGTKDRFHQAGIVSWGIGCGDAIPGVYVNVPYFKNWIDSTVKEEGLNTTSFTYRIHDYRLGSDDAASPRYRFASDDDDSA